MKIPQFERKVLERQKNGQKNGLRGATKYEVSWLSSERWWCCKDSMTTRCCFSSILPIVLVFFLPIIFFLLPIVYLFFKLVPYCAHCNPVDPMQNVTCVLNNTFCTGCWCSSRKYYLELKTVLPPPTGHHSAGKYFFEKCNLRNTQLFSVWELSTDATPLCWEILQIQYHLRNTIWGILSYYLINTIWEISSEK